MSHTDTPPRLSNSTADRVAFASFPVTAERRRRCPRVRLLRDWATYTQGQTFVVYQQLNDAAHGTAIYRGVLEDEAMPEGELGGRSIPAEIAAEVLTVKEAVARAREASRIEALECCRFVRSRGTVLGALSPRDGVCDPHQPGDAHEWRGSMRHLRAAVDEILGHYPLVSELFLTGGFDGSLDGSTLKAFLSGEDDYVPWASSWTVTVWTRAGGWHFDA